MAQVPSDANPVATKWTPERMLARLDGDRELAVELAGIFVEECPRMLQRLREAVAAGSADEVRRAAHALKGSVSNFIDGGPTATAFELETMARESHNTAKETMSTPFSRASNNLGRTSNGLPADTKNNNI